MRTLTALKGNLFTNFSAREYNRRANLHDPLAFSNGDGVFIYPGKRGPLPSIRLENLRDGFEDAALLRRLPKDQRHALVSQAISFRTGWPGSGPALGVNISAAVAANPMALEALRRRAAEAAWQSQPTGK